MILVAGLFTSAAFGGSPPLVSRPLDDYVIPELVVQDMSLNECLALLAVKWREIKTAKGLEASLNVVLKATKAQRELRINFQATGITFRAAYEKIAQAAGLECKVKAYAVWIAPRGFERAQESPIGTTPIGQLVSRLILPKVEFRDATLQEAIDFLRLKARKVDPTGRGVGLRLDVHPKIAAKLTLTFSLEQIPLSEVLQFVADILDLDLIADGETLVLTSMKS